MIKEDEYAKLRENQKKKQLEDENLKPKQPQCRRCGKKGHLAQSCIQPRKPTDKD
jgi:ribosomal protein S27AE